jgi:predicted HTH transcriptional regulator
MIFEGKILEQISNDEIISIVNEHLSERQHVEYKVTINHRDDTDRFETLCDICSFANSGGGYLIVGIRDDGSGRAQKIETVNDPERIVRSIRSLCIDHIAERIDGLEMEVREINGDSVILIRIPSSGRFPHMVTFDNNTQLL